MLALAGCGRQGRIEKDPEKSTPPERRGIVTTGGTTTKRKQGDASVIVWVVSWKSAEANFLTEKDYSGRMNGISGMIYERGRPVGSFTADLARAYRESDRLTLSGNVKLTSDLPDSMQRHGEPPEKAVLTCDELEWDAGEDLVKAKKNVIMDASEYKMGAFPELWCTPGFDLVGTPALFQISAAEEVADAMAAAFPRDVRQGAR